MALKNTGYFELFLEGVKYSKNACDYLSSVINEYDYTALETKLEEIHEIEHEADNLKHLITKKIVKDFITPIEREDIIALISQIDDVTDLVEAIMQKLYVFHIKEIHSDAIAFVDVLSECCDALCSIFKVFGNFKKSSEIIPLIIKVNDLEEKGDRLFMSAMHKLYGNNTDPVSIMVWSAIYDQFEKCCDACENTANLVEEVIMKNS